MSKELNILERVLPKQLLYKTAYSPLFDCYVGIIAAWKLENGTWIFMCNSDYKDNVTLHNHLFTEAELERFVL